MYLQRGDTGGIIVSEDQPKCQRKQIKEEIYNKQSGELKDLWGRKVNNIHSQATSRRIDMWDRKVTNVTSCSFL